MIKLLQFKGFYVQPNYDWVWVNPLTIIYMNQFTRKENHLRLPDEPTVRQEEVTTTVISFVAGLHEESDSIRVKETPEEIVDKIRLWKAQL